MQKEKKNRHTASLATMIGNTRDLHPNISIMIYDQ